MSCGALPWSMRSKSGYRPCWYHSLCASVSPARCTVHRPAALTWYSETASRKGRGRFSVQDECELAVRTTRSLIHSVSNLFRGKGLSALDAVNFTAPPATSPMVACEPSSIQVWMGVLTCRLGVWSSSTMASPGTPIAAHTGLAHRHQTTSIRRTSRDGIHLSPPFLEVFMSLKCGIVGLPNVGKSTLFNALTKAGIAAENYPFCTIEPNVGIVELPDPRLDQLAAIVKPERIVPAIVEFVDIAGLVAGASKGEGLGNQFLAHIRETDAIVNVVRCFDDPNIVHVAGKVDPVSDVEVIQTELCLADLGTVEKTLQRSIKAAKSGNDKEAAKPAMFVGNVDEAGFENNPYLDRLREYAAKEKAPVVVICAKMEAEMADMS